MFVFHHRIEELSKNANLSSKRRCKRGNHRQRITEMERERRRDEAGNCLGYGELGNKLTTKLEQ
jgi:hypothetical protein